MFNYLAMQRRGYGFFKGPEDPKIHNQVSYISKRMFWLTCITCKHGTQRIVDSELYGNQYKLYAMMMTDLNNAIFKADIANGNVNSFRQNLQIHYTKKLISMVVGAKRKRPIFLMLNRWLFII